MVRKLGKLPRKFNPRIAHMSAILPAKSLPIPPASVDWTKGVKDFGMMLNDQLGDCSCAGIYHAKQIWTLNASQEITESDNSVLKLYEQATGYKPNQPWTDQGGVLQDVLMHCTNVGIPLDDGSMEKFVGFIEVDQRNVNDVKTAINEFGLVYIGFNVPQNLFDPNTGDPPQVWQYTGCSDFEGGHCVILAGYDSVGPTVISWGETYKMTWEFFQSYCDEVYAIVSQDWVDSNNPTPLGMSLADLENLMSAIKE